jgi:hypothetical protein
MENLASFAVSERSKPNELDDTADSFRPHEPNKMGSPDSIDVVRYCKSRRVALTGGSSCQGQKEHEASDASQQTGGIISMRKYKLNIPRTRLSVFGSIILQDHSSCGHEPIFEGCPVWIRSLLSCYFQVLPNFTMQS